MKILLKIIINISMLLISLFLILLIFEIVLRVFFPIYAPVTKRNHSNVELMEYNSRFGWLHKKDLCTWIETSEYSTSISLNVNYLRGKLYKYEKPEGLKRILVLGDSFVFGLGVNDNETFSVKLEEMFNLAGFKTDVINMGVNGFGTDQEFLFLRDEGFKYSPDIVVCFLFVGNDIRENSKDSQYGKFKPYFTLDNNKLRLNNYPVPISESDIKESVISSGPRGRVWLPFGKNFLQKHSYAYIFFRLRYNYLLFKLGVRKSNENNAPVSCEVTKAILLEMKWLCQSNKSRFIVAIIPTKEQLLGVESTGFQEEFRVFAQKKNLEYIDLLDFLKDKRDLNFVIDSHWNKKGHEYIARILFNVLKEEK
jgi:hypothetical protein